MAIKTKLGKKFLTSVSFLSEMKGSLLMGGSLGKEFCFNCFSCDTKVKRPVKSLTSQTVVSCINPKCPESYIIQKDENDEFEVIRCVIKFSCSGCNRSLDVPTSVFRDLHFNQILNVRCKKCNTLSKVIMRPLMKSVEGSYPDNKTLRRTDR